MELDGTTYVAIFIAIMLAIDKIASWIVNVDRAKDVVDKRNPLTELKAKVEKHDDLLERDHQHLIEHDKDIKKLNSDFSSLIADVKADNSMIKKLLFMVLDGMTGEANKEDLKEAKAELLEHISK